MMLEAAKALDIVDVAMRLGLTTGKTIIRCPFHKERSASFRLGWHNRFHCFGCSADGDTIDLVARYLDKTHQEACAWLTGQQHLSPRPDEASPALAAETIHPFMWRRFWDACEPGNLLAHKGLQADTFGVRKITATASKLLAVFPPGGLFVPYWQNGYITYGRRRDDDGKPKFMGPKGVPLRLYGQPSLMHLPGPLYVCEGETDAMTLMTLDKAVLSFPGASSVRSNSCLQAFMRTLPHWGAQITEIILAFDNDDAGNTASDNFASFLKLANIQLPYRRLELGPHKDVNEAYNHGRPIS